MSAIEEVKLEQLTNGLEVSNSSTKRPDGSSKEKLCKEALEGDIENIWRILGFRDPPFDVNNLFRLLTQEGAETETAILSAVNKENITLLKSLLKLRHGDSSQRSCVCNPLMLATKVGNCEMIKLLMKYDENVQERDQEFKCSSCSKINIPPAIKYLKVFLTLSSPLYLSVRYLSQETSSTTDMRNRNDPIYKALELRAKLRERASLDYQFKENYLALSDGLDNFLLDLLNECSEIEEVTTVMNTYYGEDEDTPSIPADYGEGNQTPSTPNKTNRHSLLYFAIKNDNAKVIIFL